MPRLLFLWLMLLVWLAPSFLVGRAVVDLVVVDGVVAVVANALAAAMFHYNLSV